MELKRYLYTAEVKSASGHQVFYIDAVSREEADARAKAGKSDGIHSEEVMVVDLHELDFTGETSTNDYGDYPEMAPESATTPAHSAPDEAQKVYHFEQRSRFGPWIEVEQPTKRSVEFVQRASAPAPGNALNRLVAEKFTSGNAIPVERITITRADYDAALSASQQQGGA
ncbi:hypothetical protein [Achromobacter sp. AGC39]